MLIENATLLEGYGSKVGRRLYYVSAYGKDIKGYAEELGKTVVNYRKYLIIGYFDEYRLILHKMYNNLYDYIQTVRSKATNAYKIQDDISEDCYFDADVKDAMLTLNDKQCILIYLTDDDDTWLIWDVVEDTLDYIHYVEDEFGMADIETSAEYEDRYDFINPFLLKELKQKKEK